jgi:hypothetical protein
MWAYDGIEVIRREYHSLHMAVQDAPARSWVDQPNLRRGPALDALDILQLASPGQAQGRATDDIYNS